jgi:hypothetical protein
MLAEVYSGFTEGFDTADLQEAKALLDAVRGSTTRQDHAKQTPFPACTRGSRGRPCASAEPPPPQT